MRGCRMDVVMAFRRRRVAAPPARVPRSRYCNGAGTLSLVAGIVAAVFAFVPLVGDLVTIPAALIAVGCGWVGAGRADAGLATNHRQALGGAALGVAALFAVFLVFAATHSSPG